MESNTALIIVDIQNDYFNGGQNPLVGSFEASCKAKEILMHFRFRKLPIVHIQHFAIRPGATFFIPGTEGAVIHEHVRPLEEEKIIKKHFPNSFRETDLLEFLHSIKVTNLIICGMMTHMCIDATVRAAKDFGFNCTVLSDACATRDLVFDGHKVQAFDVNASFLAGLSYFYASVKKTEECILESNLIRVNQG